MKKERTDLHQVELMFKEAGAGTRPPSLCTVTGITRLPSTPSQNTSKRRNEHSQLKSVNLGESLTFTCDQNTELNYQDCSRRECNDKTTNLNNGTTVDLYDGGQRMAEANDNNFASNLSEITCTELEKLRILQLLRDHDMKDALEKEKIVLEERRWRKKRRDVIDLSSTLPTRNRPLSRYDLYHHSNHKPNPVSRPLSKPVPQLNTIPHSQPTSCRLSRPQSEPTPHLPSSLHSSSLQSASLIHTLIPIPTPIPNPTPTLSPSPSPYKAVPVQSSCALDSLYWLLLLAPVANQSYLSTKITISRLVQ